MMVASLGSIAYAEDDGRHIIGIKAGQSSEVSEPVREGQRELTPREEVEGKFCCHVLECDNEVRRDSCSRKEVYNCCATQQKVRQICALVHEYFHGFLLQREEHQQKEEADQQQQVKAKMLKRLSTPPEQGKSEKNSRAASRKVSQQAEISLAAAGESSDPLAHAILTLTEEAQLKTQQTPRPPLQGDDSIADEISRQFEGLIKEPSRRQRQRAGGPKASKGPNLKRITSEDKADSNNELLPPISMNKVAKHDGRVVTQTLEDTTGIEVIDQLSDYLILKGKQRPSVTTMQAGPPSPHKQSRPESSDSTHSGNVLRTSLLLETMEEGEQETRIDGDGKEAILVQTRMGEKETAIVGSLSHAMLLPTSELSQYNEAEKEKENSVPPAPPPAPAAVAPPPPPPEPHRKPWPSKPIPNNKL